MAKMILTVIISVICSILSVVLLLPVFVASREKITDKDFVRKQYEVQQQKVWTLVAEDVEKYGIDIYILFCDITQHRRQGPDSDFGADKSFKKLEVTYPESNTYKIALALKNYKAIINRDMICIERVISEIPSNGKTSLLPNGLELEPLLYIAMYNYHLRTKRFNVAYSHLKVLEEKYGDSLICISENNLIFIKDWLAQQKQIADALAKYNR